MLRIVNVVKAHDKHGGALVRPVHVVDMLRKTVHRILVSPLDITAVLAPVIAVVRNVPEAHQIFVIGDNGALIVLVLQAQKPKCISRVAMHAQHSIFRFRHIQSRGHTDIPQIPCIESSNTCVKRR